MLKFNYLILSGENHFMLSDNVASTNRRYSNFVFIPLLALLASVIGIGICLIQCLIHGIRQCQCRAARCIQLLVMMFLYDLHIKPCRCEHLCRFFEQFHQSIDSERHICDFKIATFSYAFSTSASCCSESPAYKARSESVFPRHKQAVHPPLLHWKNQ